MDREIKFRAWTGERMVFPCEVSLCGGAINRTFEDGYVETCPPPEGTIDDYELMQFTGLKDKNGVEIYFGDILATSNDNPDFDLWAKEDMGCTVVLENKHELGVSFSDWGMDCYEKDSIYYKDFVEVIGNVHEHPELLK